MTVNRPDSMALPNNDAQAAQSPMQPNVAEMTEEQLTMMMMPPPPSAMPTGPPPESEARSDTVACLRKACIIYTSILIALNSLMLVIYSLLLAFKDDIPELPEMPNARVNLYLWPLSICIYIFGLVAVTGKKDWRAGVMAYGYLLVVRHVVQFVPLIFIGKEFIWNAVIFTFVGVRLTFLVFFFAFKIPKKPKKPQANAA